MKTIEAYVNHGRWVADCPDCNGAELVKLGSIFRCNTGIHYGSCPAFEYMVLFPPHWEIIQTVLSVRPMINRNWDSRDTVEKLKRDNFAHGLSAGV